MPITVTFLEISDPGAINPPQRPPGVAYELTRDDDPGTAQRFYKEIGREYSWTDRLRWPLERWAEWTSGAEGWVAYAGEEPAGYFLLRSDAPESIEIPIFGLVPSYVGAGIGGHLLTDALHRGLELAPRVWLHTCTLDHPAALPNYEARGMRVLRTEERG